MSAPQFFAAPADLTAERVVLRGDEARHAASVLRLRVGERIRAADGSGRVASAVLTVVSPNQVEAEVEYFSVEAARRPALTLLVGLTKGDKLDLVVQKATELGVEAIVPVACRRSVVRWDEIRAAAAQRRLATIALAAAKQSHRAWPPRVGELTALPAAVGAAPAPLLVCWEDATASFAAALPAAPTDALTMLIGPEGGLEAEEVDRCREQGAAVVSLGGLILRTETAAIAAAAAVAFRYGWLG